MGTDIQVVLYHSNSKQWQAISRHRTKITIIFCCEADLYLTGWKLKC